MGSVMVVLENFSVSDIPELMTWIEGSDEEFLIQFAGPQYRYPLDEEQLLATMNGKHCAVFKAVEKKTNTVIGHCQLLKINLTEKSATIGRVLIKPGVRGYGYGSKMINELIKYAKIHFDICILRLKVYEFNTAAYQCYRKLDFVELERKEIRFDRIGKTWNCITMERRPPSIEDRKLTAFSLR